MKKYEGPIEPGMIFTSPDNDGKLGYRRVRVLAPYPEGGWLLEDLPARIKIWSRQPFRCREFNLRIVFVPEKEEVPA